MIVSCLIGMSNKAEGISPVRAKSKLKKRRRQRESELSNSCSLQRSFPAAAAAPSSDINKKRLKNDPTTTNKSSVGAFDSGVHCNSSISQKENNAVIVSKPNTLPDRKKGLTYPSQKSSVNNGETTKLSFIDEMDHRQLSAVGNDILSSFRNVDVAPELERAFASPTGIFDTTDENVFHHGLIGSIGPPHKTHNIGDDDGAFSIGFPRCNFSETSYTSSSQTVTLKRRTCHGMGIPLSWCQFPGPVGNTKTKTDSTIATDVTDQFDSTTNEQAMENREEDVVSSASSKYQGRIRITSHKGATIREVFDIDESDYVVGKLRQGDERYFIEKKMLSAPPPDSSDDDGSDIDSDDEDCVAVVRYKIVLNDLDCIGCSHEFVERDAASGKTVGWISDRGRLANDPYFILKELDDVNA